MRTTPLTGEVVRALEQAVLFKSDTDSREHWIPRSVCVDGNFIEDDDTEIVVEDWFLIQESIA